MRRPRHMANVWEIAILRAIASLGGAAFVKEINVVLHKFIELTDDDLRPLESALGRPAYVNQVRSHLANLRDANLLARLGRGRYMLTQAGKQRANLSEVAARLKAGSCLRSSDGS